MSQRKSLKNFPLYLPGQSKELSNLRTKTIQRLKNWENAQTRRTPKKKELILQKAAANALHEYSMAYIKNSGEKYHSAEKSRIGTAQNMSGMYLPTMNFNYTKPRETNNSKFIRRMKRSRENWNEGTKALSGVNLHSNMLGGRRSKRQTRRK